MVFAEPREQLLVSFIFRIYFQAIFIFVILFIALHISWLFNLIAIYILVFGDFYLQAIYLYQVFINRLITCSRFEFVKNQFTPPLGCLSGPTILITYLANYNSK